MRSPGRGGPSQLPYRVLAGVVPCPGGWLVAATKIHGSRVKPERPRVFPTFAEVLAERPTFELLAVGCPIGLLETPGERRCDREARALLGTARARAVVRAPSRPALEAKTRAELAQAEGGRTSRTTWLLKDHIAELDAAMEPYLQRSVFSVNPEVAFLALNHGVALRTPRYTSAGCDERAELLGRTIRVEALSGLEGTVGRRRLVDAGACLWMARRIDGRAFSRLPAEPEWDARGLRMELVG